MSMPNSQQSAESSREFMEVFHELNSGPSVNKLIEASDGRYGHKVNCDLYKMRPEAYQSRTAYTFDENGKPTRYLIASVLMHSPFMRNAWKKVWICMKTDPKPKKQNEPVSASNPATESNYIFFRRFIEDQWNSISISGVLTDRFLVPYGAAWKNSDIVASSYGSNIPMSIKQVTKQAWADAERNDFNNKVLINSTVIEIFPNSIRPQLAWFNDMPASNNPWFDFGAIKKTYHVEAPTVKNIISGYATIDFSDQKIGDVKYGLDTYYANNPMRARYVARGLALLYPNSQIDKSSHVAATAIAEWSDTQLIKDLSSESSSRAMTLYNKVKHAPVGFDWTANLFAESDPQIENKVIYKLRGISRHIHDVQDVVQNDVSSQFNIGTLDIPIPANIELQVPIDLDDVDGIPFENHPEEMEITGHRFLEESEGEAVSTTTESIPVEEASNEEILIDDLDKHIAS